MQICLVRPPAVTNSGIEGQNPVPPIGLAYVAAALQEAGHEVCVVDAVGEGPQQYRRVPGVTNAVSHGLTAAQVAERISPDVDLIGVACMFSVTWPYDQQVLEAIRARHSRPVIVVGGEHATAACEYILETCPEVDYCVTGEGEQTMVELCQALTAGSDPRELPGICLRVEGGPRRNPARARIAAIDEIPEPAWSLFNIPAYQDNDLTWGVNLGVSMPMLATRGCPYRCAFCSSQYMWTTIWRARDPELVIAEMKRYIDTYGATSFNFYDLTAIVKKEWIVAFASRLIEEDLDITWQLPSGSRAEPIDGDLSRLLYRSGCRHLNFAPESGSPAMLERIRKRVKPERVLNSIRVAHAAGLETKINIIVGFPDETPSEVLETCRFIVRVALAGANDMGPYLYVPYPGADLFNQLVQAGRIRMDEAYYRGLLAFTDPGNNISFSETFTARQLELIRIGMAVLFYSVSFARRPHRALALIIDLMGRNSTSKLSKQLAHAKRKADALLARSDEDRRRPGLLHELIPWVRVLAGRVDDLGSTESSLPAPSPVSEPLTPRRKGPASAAAGGAACPADADHHRP